MLTPRRHHGPEILDQRDVPLQLRARSHRDIAVANRLFGGTRALLATLAECAHALPRVASFLDIGTGTGEATAHARRFGEAHGIALHTIALDLDASLAHAARRHADEGVCASALELPLADRSIDVVACHQVAHHFEGAALATLLGEMHRVARCRVIVSDLRRSWIAACGLWLASFPLGFHPVSRHDGVVSVLRGFTVAELESVVYDSCGVRPEVRRRPGFRLTASWTPAP
ncbi:MAG: methyltransferase domain-containing protein [Gemmatimonadaceae bacterium]